MIWTQFFYRGSDGVFNEACGDRSVIILDGRNKEITWRDISRQEMIKRKYDAYQIFRGESFTRSIPITDVLT